MTIYYSPSTHGFYDSNINPVIPPDGIEITSEEHAALLQAQASGSIIQPDGNGNPIAVVPAAPTLAQVQSSLCASVDACADAAYISVGGPSPGRLAEYQQANNDANVYKAAGYSGSVPETVQCWATAAAITPKAAADSILTTAAQWMAVLNGVRSARLLGKAAINATATQEDAQAAATSAIANIRQAASGA